MKAALPLLVLTAVAIGCASADATPPNAASSILKAPLGCAISQGKVVVITNTTGAGIAAGTSMGYDAERYGSGQHYGKTFAGPAIAAGGILKIGAEPATSCTAWYTRTLMMAPP